MSVTLIRGCWIRLLAYFIRRFNEVGPFDFVGFPGLTNHHTWSSPKRFKACNEIRTWPSWAGSKDPPKRPTRRPALEFGKLNRIIPPVYRRFDHVQGLTIQHTLGLLKYTFAPALLPL